MDQAYVITDQTDAEAQNHRYEKPEELLTITNTNKPQAGLTWQHGQRLQGDCPPNDTHRVKKEND